MCNFLNATRFVGVIIIIIIIIIIIFIIINVNVVILWELVKCCIYEINIWANNVLISNNISKNNNIINNNIRMRLLLLLFNYH